MKEEERTAIANTWTYHQDFPKPGINFVNILPLFQHQALVKATVSALAEAVRGLGTKVDIITAIESRGFLFGTLLAAELDIPFVAIRKAGELDVNIDALLRWQNGRHTCVPAPSIPTQVSEFDPRVRWAADSSSRTFA